MFFEPNPVFRVFTIHYSKSKYHNLIITIECGADQYDVLEEVRTDERSIIYQKVDAGIFPEMLCNAKTNITTMKLLNVSIPLARNVLELE
jgi:hypothetical protein